MTMTASPLPLERAYSALPERLYSEVPPTPVAQPGLLRINHALCEELGVDAGWLASDEGLAVLAGNAEPAGVKTLATVYAGHQFGQFNPQLGDGRALLLGDLRDRRGRPVEIQLKGAGRTPYSRGGDGRSPLGPVLREYLISEAMFALGVPTTRALAAVRTGEDVLRNGPEPGAILARVASSHIRVGTFQFFAARDDHEALAALVDHVLARHYPDIDPGASPALALIEAVIARQARLIAQWQHLGFVHGVMNTDNMLLCGETVDYGPCAFLEAFRADAVFSSIDYAGRYAYRNQPGIAHWNLARFAETLVPLLADEEARGVELARAALDTFPARFAEAHTAGLGHKLGLATVSEEDARLIEDLFAVMSEEALDFTLTFRHLAGLPAPDAESDALADLYQAPASLTAWVERWRERLAAEAGDSAAQRGAAQRGAAQRDAMRRHNPLFIPRNHLVQRAIEASSRGDDSLFHRFVERFGAPFSFAAKDLDLARPAQPDETVHQTFCGT
jgi:uncharacterized protein YdiU (UPF0061 family)